MHLFKCMLLIKALDFNSGNGDILVNYEDGIVSGCSEPTGSGSISVGSMAPAILRFYLLITTTVSTQITPQGLFLWVLQK